MSISEWLRWWEWNSNTCNRVMAICTVIALIAGLTSWIKPIRNLAKNILDKLKSFIFFILSWIREKIIGKENLELLKELKVLKSNKRAIEILGYLSSEDKSSKVNGYYEAILSFMCLYSYEMDFNEFKKAYEKDEEDRILYGAGINVDKLRVKKLKELIKKYSK